MERDVEQQEADARRRILDAINELALIREARRPVDERNDALREQVKQYLGLHGEDAITDEETGVTAKLQDRQGAELIDILAIALRVDGLEVLRELARGGYLECKAAPVRTAYGKGGASWMETALRYANLRGAGSTALLVEKAK